MQCAADFAWICLSFPALLPVIAGLLEAGHGTVDVDYARWTTSFGRLDLAIVEQTASGVYPAHSGTLEARTEDGRHLVGHWFQPESEKPCDRDLNGSRNWGRLSFHAVEGGKRFEGQWAYCDEPMGSGGVWNGTLVETRTHSIPAPPTQ